MLFIKLIELGTVKFLFIVQLTSMTNEAYLSMLIF